MDRSYTNSELKIHNDLMQITDEVSDTKMDKILLEKRFTCYVDEVESRKRENEKTILSLREITNKLRESYNTSIRGDEKIIAEVFSGRNKREMLALQKCEIEPAICELDEQLAKRFQGLEYIKHVQKKRKRSLLELTDEVDDLTKVKDTEYETSLQQIVNVIHNNIDKTKIKTESAMYIGRCYKQIRDRLHRDVEMFPSKIHELELKMMKDRVGTEEIRRTFAEAASHKNQTQERLHYIERQCYNEKRHRDLASIKAKKLSEEHFLDIEAKNKNKVEPKNMTFGTPFQKARKSLLGGFDNALSLMRGEHDDKSLTERIRQTKLLELTCAFESMKDNLQVSDVDNIIKRFTEQETVNKSLGCQKRERLKRLDDIRCDILKAEQNVQKLKYSTDSPEKNIDDRGYEIVSKRTTEREAELDDLKRKFADAEKLFYNVKVATMSLFDKVSVVKLKPPHNNFSKGNPVVDLNNIMLRLQSVLDELSSIKDKDVVQKCIKNKQDNDYMKFISSRIPTSLASTSPFFTQPSEIDASGFFEEELEERPDCLSHNDIKARSAKILEFKPSKKR